MTRTELMNSLCEGIIRRLEEARDGVAMSPFRSPWQSGGDPFPVNMTTGNRYNGMNVFLLWGEAMDKGYSSNEWMTVRQLLDHAERNGLEVSFKGQKTATIFRMVDFFPKGTDRNDERNMVCSTKVYGVLNRDQVEGLPDLPVSKPITITRRDQHQFIENTGADIKFGGTRAYFDPKLDYIQLPHIDNFVDEDAYLATAFHELGHWTGHASRLDRSLHLIGDKNVYAFEELVAEMTSAFICAHHHIEEEMQHPQYIEHYIRILKNDMSLLRKASTKASEAYQFLLEKQTVRMTVAA